MNKVKLGFHEMPPKEVREKEDDFSPPERRKPVRIRPTRTDRRPMEWEADEDPLVIPEWRDLALAEMPLAVATRHVLALGETGSGKTQSAVIPFLRAVARHRTAEGLPSLLVIDPKMELVQELEAIRETTSDAQIIHFGTENGPVLDRFEDIDPLDLDAAETVRRIVSPSSAYRREREVTNNSFFLAAGERILEQLIAIDLTLYRSGGVAFLKAFWSRVPDHMYGARPDLSYRPDQYLTRFTTFLRYATDHQDTAYRALERTLAEFGLGGGKHGLQIETFPDDTYASVVATLANAIRDASSEDVARHVSLNPFEARPNAFSVREAMEAGRWVTYQPLGRSLADDYIGRALKSSFFRMTFKRRGGRGFFAVADEAHRFATSDPETGEQSYLDRCRAYRASCMLATQSLASLSYSFQSGSPTPASALDLLLANIGTTLFFRSSDPSTMDRLRSLIPDPFLPDRPHILAVRPPSTLSPGECFAIMGNGRWGRFHIHLTTAQKPAER